MDAQLGAVAGVSALLAGDRERAWDRFINRYASLLLQVAEHFGADTDQVRECFVFVCEKLRERDLKRLRRFDPGGSASFETWLRAVARNLCLDWHRSQFGRPRLYRSLERLPAVEREICRCIHLRGLGEAEAYHTVRAIHPSVTRTQFADCLARIQKALSSRQSWLLSAGAQAMVSLSGSPGNPGESGAEREVADLGPDPEEEASRQEYLSALGRALRRLPKRQRLLVRMRFEQELSLEQIARLTGLDGPRQVQGLLRQAVAMMRREMAASLEPAVSVKDS